MGLFLLLSACSSGTAEPGGGVAGVAGAGTGGSSAGSSGASAGSAGVSAGSAGLITPEGDDAGASGASDGGAGTSAGGSSSALAGAAGMAGAGGSASLPSVVSYTGSAANKGATKGRVNIGQEFTVGAGGVHIRDLGVWDAGADGLSVAHVVTLFSLKKPGLNPGAGAVPVPDGSVAVPAGKVAALELGYRFAPLAHEIALEPGNYAVVAYGMADTTDAYGDGGNIPFSGSGVSDAGFSPFQFVDAPSPAFPNGGDQLAHASASFRFSSAEPPFIRIMPLGASITDGYMGTLAGYRGPLHSLFEAAHFQAQFVGSVSDNFGALPLDQRHHEGHSGYTIQGLQDNIVHWLGPTGSPAELVLLLVGTNDIVQNSDLANAGARLSKLISTICDKSTGLLPNARVIVAQLPPLKNVDWAAREVGYNQSVATVVAAHAKLGEAVQIVDMHAVVSLDDLSSDGEHPKDSGYIKMAQAWLDVIQSKP